MKNDVQKHEDTLFECISALINFARKRVKTAIDTTMVYTYYGVGQYIMDFNKTVIVVQPTEREF